MTQSRSPLRHERTERGHILYTNTLSLLLGSMIFMILLTVVMLFAARPFVEPDMQSTFTVLIGVCVLWQILGALTLVWLMAGRRLELDREGVHLRYKYRKGVTIPWSAVRDWGLSSPIPARESGPVTLYFSAVELPLAGSQSKNTPQNKQTVVVNLTAADLSHLIRMGFFTFCRACIGENGPEAFQAHRMEGVRHEN